MDIVKDSICSCGSGWCFLVKCASECKYMLSCQVQEQKWQESGRVLPLLMCDVMRC